MGIREQGKAVNVFRHNRDECPRCLRGRILALCRRGLNAEIGRELHEDGTDALPLIEMLEKSTDEQLAMMPELPWRSSIWPMTQGSDSGPRSVWPEITTADTPMIDGS